MSATVDARIQLKRESTQYWNEHMDFIPLEGEVIIYEDYKIISKEIDGNIIDTIIPGIKIGNGHSSIQELSFISEVAEVIDGMLILNK